MALQNEEMSNLEEGTESIAMALCSQWLAMREEQMWEREMMKQPILTVKDIQRVIS